jgi:hypothetical protein
MHSRENLSKNSCRIWARYWLQQWRAQHHSTNNNNKQQTTTELQIEYQHQKGIGFMGSFVSQLIEEGYQPELNHSTNGTETSEPRRASVKLINERRRTSCTIELRLKEDGTCDSIEITEKQEDIPQENNSGTDTLETTTKSLTLTRSISTDAFSEKAMEELRAYLQNYKFPLNQTDDSVIGADATDAESGSYPKKQEYSIEMFCGKQYSTDGTPIVI